MGLILKILLAVDAVLLLLLLVYVIFRLVKEKSVKEELSEKVQEKPAEIVEDKEEQVIISEAVEESTPTGEIVISDIEDDREIIKRIPFSEKMLSLDVKSQSYYNELYNKFISYRRINPRVSAKCVSFRLGKELVAKISVRGKTMKLNLKLDVSKFEQNVFFQKDSSDVKAYQEVPFTVKVKSDRGLKNAVKLIEAMAEENNIEKKVRYNAIDALAELKDIAESK